MDWISGETVKASDREKDLSPLSFLFYGGLHARRRLTLLLLPLCGLLSPPFLVRSRCCGLPSLPSPSPAWLGHMCFTFISSPASTCVRKKVVTRALAKTVLWKKTDKNVRNANLEFATPSRGWRTDHLSVARKSGTEEDSSLPLISPRTQKVCFLIIEKRRVFFLCLLWLAQLDRHLSCSFPFFSSEKAHSLLLCGFFSSSISSFFVGVAFFGSGK